MNPEQPSTREQLSPTALPEQQEAEPVPQPRIWVASLADYNNGGSHGAWLDAARETEEVEADIQRMLTDSPWAARTGEPAERWSILGYENFGRCRIDEHEDLDWVTGVAQGIVVYGLAFAAWADVVEDPTLLLDFEEAYLGHHADLQTYIEQLINDRGYVRILDEALPASIRPYVKIDITAAANGPLGRDLHALPAADGGVWVFR
jgi:antirestriction protein